MTDISSDIFYDGVYVAHHMIEHIDGCQYEERFSGRRYPYLRPSSEIYKLVIRPIQHIVADFESRQGNEQGRAIYTPIDEYINQNV